MSASASRSPHGRRPSGQRSASREGSRNPNAPRRSASDDKSARGGRPSGGQYRKDQSPRPSAEGTRFSQRSRGSQYESDAAAGGARPPYRSGGRSGADDRPGWRGARPARTADREGRPGRPERGARPYGDRNERPERGARPYGDRNERPERSARPYGNRDSRPSGEGRRPSTNQGWRGARPAGEERPRRADADSQGWRGARPASGGPRQASTGGRFGSGDSARPVRSGKPNQNTAGEAYRNRAQHRRPHSVPSRHEPSDQHVAEGMRLQKVLAQAGVASRRASEELIHAGRVSVNGDVVRELGTRVDPETAVIHVDGTRIQLDSTRVYMVLNKPRGVVTTMKDPEGRPCVGDIVGQREDRLFHVGRLDVDTEGLLILTNDGDLAHRLQHPTYEVPKTYLAEIPGPVPKDLGRTLRAGIPLEDGPVKVDSFRLVDSKPGKALVEVVLREGRNHVVRRMFAAVGHPVLQLARVRIGPVHLGSLAPGRMRPLTSRERGELMTEAGM